MKKNNTFKDVTLEEVFNHEKIRYESKGYGIVFSVIMVLAWFLLVPKLATYIWPYKIESPGSVFFILSYLTHEGIFLIANFMFWIIYKVELPFFERYKVHDKQWPWKENPSSWNKLLKETIGLLIFNHCLMLPLVMLPYYIFDTCSYRLDFESLPSSFEVIWQTVFFMFMDDFAFYWLHRFMHWDRIYPYIHKVHHQYQNSVSIASDHAHPIEFLCVNVLTSNAGAILLGQRVHFFTYLMWIVHRILETTDGHCGYEFSWSPYRLLPMSGSSEFHNYHHLLFKGNYSSWFTYMDSINGTTNTKYIDFVEKKKEMHDVNKNKVLLKENEIKNKKEVNDKIKEN